MYTAQIDRIQAKLGEVRRLGKQCFGSGTHKLKLNPPALEEEVANFESQHGIRLPEEYRVFLLTVGNGGAGPYYGLLPLQRSTNADLEFSERPLNAIALPCPLFPGMSREKNWIEQLGCTHDECYQGIIQLAAQGCTYCCMLVVSGPHKGRVVYIDEEYQAPYFPENPDFLSWYERWLDELLWDYDGSWFGFGMPGQEADFLRILGDSSTPSDTRVAALGGMHRLPRLSCEAKKVVLNCLGDSRAAVRERALLLLAKFGVAGRADMVVPLLADPDPKVRKAALRAVRKEDADAWLPAVRGLLRGSDRDVIRAAITALDDLQFLRPEDLLPLLDSPENQVRTQAVHALGKVGGAGAVGALVGALSHPEPHTRAEAIRSLTDLEATDAVPAIVALLGTEADPMVLSNAIKALARLKDPAAVPALIEAMQHPDPLVRYDAAWALGELGDARAIPALEALEGDQTRPERRDAMGRMEASTMYTVGEQAGRSLIRLGQVPWYYADLTGLSAKAARRLTSWREFLLSLLRR